MVIPRSKSKNSFIGYGQGYWKAKRAAWKREEKSSLPSSAICNGWDAENSLVSSTFTKPITWRICNTSSTIVFRVPPVAASCRSAPYPLKNSNICRVRSRVSIDASRMGNFQILVVKGSKGNNLDK